MSEACTHDPFLDIRKKNNRKIFKKKKERERDSFCPVLWLRQRWLPGEEQKS